MALVMTSGPASEPVTVAEAKAHLRLDGAAEDLLIASLILTSRLHIEAALGLALITQSWRLILDRWPEWPEVPIPLRPVQAIASVNILSEDGTPAAMPASGYILDGRGVPPRLIRTGARWPAPGRAAAGIEVAFTAGYGAAASDVPAPIRQALLMLVAHWYEHRDPIEIGSPVLAIPSAVSELLAPYREARL
jgi:uncharacterized phiE125 gp8 family phage protein